MTKQEINEVIEEIRILEYNWDGYNAIPVHVKIIEQVCDFISSLKDTHIEIITDIFPNPTGTMDLEFQSSDNQKQVSIEFGLSTVTSFQRIGDVYNSLVDREVLSENLDIILNALNDISI